MEYFTKSDLISVLENMDDECRVCVRAWTPVGGDCLFFDLTVGVTMVDDVEVVYIGSDDLDLSVRGDLELLKDE